MPSPPPAPCLPHWTHAGTLLLPVAPEALPLPAPVLHLDGIELARKRELHVTIVGSALAARLRAAPDHADASRAAIDDTIARLDWRWRRCRAWTLLCNREGGQRRHALVEHVALPAMAEFHRRLGESLGRQLPVPPAHVTLYTAGGGNGIGLPDAATLARLRVRDVDPAELDDALPWVAG
jgi:hypothetical protein